MRPPVCIWFLQVLLLQALGALVPILIIHKRLILRTRIRILSIIVATIAAGLIVLICAAILSAPQQEAALSLFMGIVSTVYGLIVSILATL